MALKAASLSGVSDERALAKLSLSFRKSLRHPIFEQNPYVGELFQKKYKT